MGYSVFLGDVARDEYYSMERLPRLGEKASVEALPTQLGGMIANAASVYASYGGEARFLSFLNPEDSDLCEQLETIGVDTSFVQYDNTLAPSKCIITLAEHEHTVLIVDMKRHKVELSDEVQEALCHADFIYSNYWELQWLNYKGLDATAVVKQWHEHGAKLICDIDVDDLDSPVYKGFVPYTYFLFMNVIGYQKLCANPSKKASMLQLLGGSLRALIATIGEGGCLVYERGREVYIPAIKVDVVDVTGAGDTFCSSFVWFFEKSQDVELSAQFATYAAARAITQVGARAGSSGVEPVFSFISACGGEAEKYRFAVQ